MPPLPALPPRRSHAVQAELICHMMKIMQEQGRAVIVGAGIPKELSHFLDLQKGIFFFVPKSCGE
eukprot:5129507-Prorocentrum_lima.AAC.1